MPSEHRTKTYLSKAVKDRVRAFTPSDLMFTDDFKIEVRGEGSTWVLVSIKDPTELVPRYYEVRITEKV